MLRIAFFAFLFLVFPGADDSHAYAFESGAPQAVLMDADTGVLLYGKDTHKHVPPSSMTKLMTAYVIFDHIKQGIISLDDTFIVSKKAWQKGGSKMFVKHRERVKLDDLLRGIIIQSGNDACIVAAEGIASEEDAFADIMNQTAQNMGLTNSYFLNASGWPKKGHYMSVYDIAVLSRRLILDFPEHYGYYSESSFTYNGIKQSNRNKLLSRNIGVDGLKTGHTEDGGYGIAVSAKQQGRRLIAVVNGLDSDRDRIDEAEKLLQYGFRYFENTVLFKKDDVVGHIDMWLGHSDTLPVRTDRDIVVPVSKLEHASLPRADIVYNGPIYAPVEDGTEIAALHIYNGDEPVAIYPLFAGETSDMAGLAMRAVKRAFYFVKQKIAERSEREESEETDKKNDTTEEKQASE